MKAKSQILPESHHNYVNLTRDDVVAALNENKTITGIVSRIDKGKKELWVQLGAGVMGHLPFEEATIYDFYYSNDPSKPLPINIFTLLSKKIRVKVTSINDNIVYLSRKANMQEALEYLKGCSSALLYVTNTTRSKAFGDIGEGICGCLPAEEVCKLYVGDINLHFHSGSEQWVNILSINEDNEFTVSYKSTFPPYWPEEFDYGDLVKGRILNSVDSVHPGYFVEISPNICGIMDCNCFTPKLKFGDMVECYVQRATDKGLKLRYIRVLS